MQERDQVLTSESENTLKEQILSLSNKEAPVRKLMWRRLVAYVRLVKTNKTLPPVPPGYNDISDELQSLCKYRKQSQNNRYDKHIKKAKVLFNLFFISYNF